MQPAASALLMDWHAWLPRGTVRLRLTLLYGTLFLVSGAALLTVTYLLVARSSGYLIFFDRGAGHKAGHGSLPFFDQHTIKGKSAFPVTRQLRAATDRLRAETDHQRAVDLHRLLVDSGVALAGMALLSVALGWLLAGRALRPVRAMTSAARRISEHNLDERITLRGPRDELNDLGVTINDLLGRLETAFSAQRRFVANASHELRTPLTRARALLEANLTDPYATKGSFRLTSARLIEICEQQERLLEALLTLASSQRGLERRDQVDLVTITAEVIHSRVAEIQQRQVQVRATLNPAPVSGDEKLIERLVANLIDNALRYNHPAGRVHVLTDTREGTASFSIDNTGPSVPTGDLERLFRPFQRSAVERTSRGLDGHGLGLSIVHAIADAHGASITARAQNRGGIAIDVTFPAATQSERNVTGIVRRLDWLDDAVGEPVARSTDPSTATQSTASTFQHAEKSG